jgi:sorbitol-specific phosphotransferase system component IIBC
MDDNGSSLFYGGSTSLNSEKKYVKIIYIYSTSVKSEPFTEYINEKIQISHVQNNDQAANNFTKALAKILFENCK